MKKREKLIKRRDMWMPWSDEYKRLTARIERLKPVVEVNPIVAAPKTEIAPCQKLASDLSLEQLYQMRNESRVNHGSDGEHYRRIAARITYIKNPVYMKEYNKQKRQDPAFKESERLRMVAYLAANPLARVKARARAAAYYSSHKRSIQQKRNSPHHSAARSYMRGISLTFERAKLGPERFPEFFGAARIGVVRGSPQGVTIATRMGLSDMYDVKCHFEGLFKKGMNWANYGKVWWIGHRVPVRDFDCSQVDEFAKCFHHTNLLPEFKGDNLLRLNEVRRDLEANKRHQQAVKIKRRLRRDE